MGRPAVTHATCVAPPERADDLRLAASSVPRVQEHTSLPASLRGLILGPLSGWRLSQVRRAIGA